MKVTSKKTISFPSFGWSIKKGEIKKLPEDKDIAKAILANRHILAEKQSEETKNKK